MSPWAGSSTGFAADVTWYEVWLFLHISAAIVWLGGAVAAQAFGLLAKRAGDPARSAAFGQDMAFVGPKVFAPAAIVVLVTGVLLTEEGNWDWTELFIWLGIVGWALVAFTGFAYLTRAMKGVGVRMAAQGPSPELGAEMNRLVLIGRLLVLVLFAIVFLMVVKPGT
jgi:uncharacterized membrane protein